MENKVKIGSFGSLFGGAIRDFKSRLKTIIALSAISIAISFLVPVVVAAGVFLGMTNVVLGTSIGIIGFLVFLFATYFVNGAFAYSMKDGAKVKESFGFIWKNIWSFLWIMALTILVVLPGFVALIIPGIIISMIISFSMFIFMDEGVKGMAALAKSREYFRGYFWPIIGRFALYILVAVGAAMVVSIIGGILGLIHESMESILQTVFNVFILAPIGLCFSWRLYKDLKEKRPEVASAPVPEKRNWIKGLAIIGAALVAVALIVAIVMAPSIKEAVEEAAKEEASNEMNIGDVSFDGEGFTAEELEELERLLNEER